MKYLKKFNTADEMSAWQIGVEHVIPNVVLTADTSSVAYNVPSISGVFIQHIDGSLYTETEWTNGGFSSDEANGVAVVDSEAQFVIAKENTNDSISWSNLTDKLIDGVGSSTLVYDGIANTELIAEASTYGAATYCASYIFSNGEAGYLASANEWKLAYHYKDDITSAINLIEGEGINENDYYWTSTQRDNDEALAYYWFSGQIVVSQKWIYRYVRPFASLIL